MNRNLLHYEAKIQLEHLGLDIDPDTPLKYLSIGQWQMVEIAKALARNAKIIAFDEPTSSLSAREIDNLFRVIRELRAEGRVIFYVSHRMEEIFALSDAVTVFKDGRYVRTFDDMTQVESRANWCRRWSGVISVIFTAMNRVRMAMIRLRLDGVKAPGVRTPSALRCVRGKLSVCLGWLVPGAAN